MIRGIPLWEAKEFASCLDIRHEGPAWHYLVKHRHILVRYYRPNGRVKYYPRRHEIAHVILFDRRTRRET